MWEWHDDELVLQDDTILNIPTGIWNDLGDSEESLSFVFDDITPVKACGDLGSHNTDSGDMSSSKKESADNTKDREKCQLNSSQVKRRRMLQFESEALSVPYCNEQMPPISLEEKGKEDTLEEAFSNISQWVSGGDTTSSGYKGLNQSSEGWQAYGLNDEIQFNSGDVVRPGASKAHNAGSFKTLPVHEASVGQKRQPRSRQNVVFKGKKSYMQTPTKATSSVVYPFAFIKPCSVDGDMTLRDINQRICTPPKPKQKEDPSSIYPTSAFSGKPVVGQMKIHTEGGKGCITIMRTKG